MFLMSFWLDNPLRLQPTCLSRGCEIVSCLAQLTVESRSSLVQAGLDDPRLFAALARDPGFHWLEVTPVVKDWSILCEFEAAANASAKVVRTQVAGTPREALVAESWRRERERAAQMQVEREAIASERWHGAQGVKPIKTGQLFRVSSAACQYSS